MYRAQMYVYSTLVYTHEQECVHMHVHVTNVCIRHKCVYTAHWFTHTYKSVYTCRGEGGGGEQGSW